MGSFDAPATVRPQSSIPGKVSAAQNYLQFAEMMRTPSPMFDGTRGEPRELNPKEQAVYDAALDVLRMYFMGEMEFEGATAAAPPFGGDDPERRVPVNV